jgi:branched-chain amino acid transport system ATP-binding protein
MIPVIRGLVSAGVTVLMIEHVMQAVMSLAEYAWVLSQGQLIFEGTPESVSKNDKVIEAYLGHGMAKRMAQSAQGAP